MAKVFDILIHDKYSSNGETRSKFYNVGTAFEVKDGLNCELPPGLAVSGRFLIRPRKAKAGAEKAEDLSADFAEDEIPY